MTIRTVAVLGANSQIGQDYIENLLIKSQADLYIFSRQPGLLRTQIPLEYKERVKSLGYEDFGFHKYDLIVNFVGASNPNQISAMGHEIFQITNHYDELVVQYLKKFNNAFYIFISSGAAYGDIFSAGPAEELTQSIFDFNDLQTSQYYGASKYFAEKRHRELTDLKILDLRIFSYFSKGQDLSSALLLSEIIRSIKSGSSLKTNQDNLYRDYIGADDFYNLIECSLSTGGINASVDGYSLGPIGKIDMLNNLKNEFGLRFSFDGEPINSPSNKKFYYSLKRRQLVDMGYAPKLDSMGLVKIGCRKFLQF